MCAMWILYDTPPSSVNNLKWKVTDACASISQLQTAEATKSALYKAQKYVLANESRASNMFQYEISVSNTQYANYFFRS